VDAAATTDVPGRWRCRYQACIRSEQGDYRHDLTGNRVCGTLSTRPLNLPPGARANLIGEVRRHQGTGAWRLAVEGGCTGRDRSLGAGHTSTSRERHGRVGSTSAGDAVYVDASDIERPFRGKAVPCHYSAQAWLYPQA